MTRQRALRLVANSRGRLCVRFVHGVDGRPITDLPVRLHRIGRRVSRVAAGAFTAALSLSSAAAQSYSETTRSLPAAVRVPAPEHEPVVAEVLSASLSGTITAGNKNSGFGAIVKLTNKETGVELITSATEGRYSFPSVYPGTYTLSAHADGYTDAGIGWLVLGKDSNRHRNLMLFPDIQEGEVVVEQHVRMTGGAVSVRLPQHPLVEAAYRDDLATVKELLFSGTDANIFDETTQTTALDQAVENGNREMVQLLLRSRANVNGGGTRRSALMSLRDNATLELLLDLIAAGAFVNQQDESGDTPLMNAAASSNLVAVKTLIKTGARVDSTNTAGETPLMRAAANDDPKVTGLLLELGADVNAYDNDGKTALLLASSSNKPAMITLLLDAGAKAEVHDKEGKTPLLVAAGEDDAKVLKLLIDAGADINAHDEDGETALMAAASHAPAELVQLLIDMGAKIDSRDKDGQTALMRATVAGDAESVKLLLDAGVDFKVRGKDGKTALALAREGEHGEIAKLLLARGAPD
jgi:ankyrin repeat protein